MLGDLAAALLAARRPCPYIDFAYDGIRVHDRPEIVDGPDGCQSCHGTGYVWPPALRPLVDAVLVECPLQDMEWRGDGRVSTECAEGGDDCEECHGTGLVPRDVSGWSDGAVRGHLEDALEACHVKVTYGWDPPIYAACLVGTPMQLGTGPTRGQALVAAVTEAVRQWEA